MPDRTINFGESEAEATYQIQDTDGAAGGGNFVVAKDTNANTVLLEYDPGTDTWEYAGDVDLNGGTLTAGSVNTEELGNNGTPVAIVDTLEREELTDGETVLFAELSDSSGSGLKLGAEATVGIGTTAETILSFSEVNINDRGSAIALVSGTRQGASGDFTDIIHFSSRLSPEVINTIERDSPAGRAYSKSGNDLQLAMASDTYDVSTSTLVGGLSV